MSELNVTGSGTQPATPSHIDGIANGTGAGNYDERPGHLPDGHATARRCAGARAKNRDLILPSTPNLSQS